MQVYFDVGNVVIYKNEGVLIRFYRINSYNCEFGSRGGS